MGNLTRSSGWNEERDSGRADWREAGTNDESCRSSFSDTFKSVEPIFLDEFPLGRWMERLDETSFSSCWPCIHAGYPGSVVVETIALRLVSDFLFCSIHFCSPVFSRSILCLPGSAISQSTSESSQDLEHGVCAAP